MSNRLPLTPAQASKYKAPMARSNPAPLVQKPIMEKVVLRTGERDVNSATAALVRKAQAQLRAEAKNAANVANYARIKQFNTRWAKRRGLPGVGKIYDGANLGRGMTYCVYCQKKTPNAQPYQFISGREIDGKPTRVRLSSTCPVCHHKKSTFVQKRTTNVRGNQIGPGYKNVPTQRHLGGGLPIMTTNTTTH